MNSTDLYKTLSKIGIKRTDTVMIHGDAIVSTQLSLNKFDQNVLNSYINMLIDFFYPNGTMIVPSFSYNMSKERVFDKLNTPSEVGMFSEAFRNKPNVLRSNHPIFSVCSIGKNSKNLTNYNLGDCFGKNSFFDLFTKLNGKIICMGCPLERITYLHFAEQKHKVHYRYIKNFNCAYRENKKNKNVKIAYYVRDLNKNASLDFKFFTPKIKNIMKKANFGRFEFTSIDANKLLNKSKILIKKYPDILVGSKSEV